MRPRRLLRAWSIAALACTSSACFTMRAELPGALRGDVGRSETTPVGTVAIEKKNWFFLWGLVGGPDSRVFADDLQRQITAAHGDGVQDLTLDAQFECMDLGVACVTGGCIEPRTYRVAGTIVRIHKAALPGSALLSPSSSPSPAAPAGAGTAAPVAEPPGTTAPVGTTY